MNVKQVMQSEGKLSGSEERRIQNVYPLKFINFTLRTNLA